MQFLDLPAQYQTIKSEIDGAIQRVIDSATFIGGPEVERLESSMATLCGTKYAVAVNSGTDALLLSLKTLGIGPGDEVITSPFTFIATAEVIAAVGAKPVFVDIDPQTFNLNSFLLEALVTPRTKAIIPVHIFGQPVSMDEVNRIAKRYHLSVIEDACQAIGAQYRGRPIGSLGDMGCFSFFPSKNLGGYGDGGMIVTNKEEWVQKLKLLRNHGSSPTDKYLNIALGTISRLDALQAAILNAKFSHLLEWNEARRQRAIYYSQALQGVRDLVLPKIFSESVPVFHQYTIRTKKRDALKKYLKEHSIPTMVYYQIPLHLQPVFQSTGYKEKDFPEAERAAHEVLSLPIYPEISLGDQDRVIKCIKAFYI